jgi:hypothetical protein
MEDNIKIGRLPLNKYYIRCVLHFYGSVERPVEGSYEHGNEP